MNQVKLIFLAAEVAALVSVMILAFTEVETEDAQFFKSMFLAILPLFAVVMQAEYQDIEWNEDEEEEAL